MRYDSWLKSDGLDKGKRMMLMGGKIHFVIWSDTQWNSGCRFMGNIRLLRESDLTQ